MYITNGKVVGHTPMWVLTSCPFIKIIRMTLSQFIGKVERVLSE